MPRHGQTTDDVGWCAYCHQHCYGIFIDDGIGAYEYWGQCCTDHQWISVSNCCLAEILEHDPEPHCEFCEKRVPQTELDLNDGLCQSCNSPIESNGHGHFKDKSCDCMA